MKRFGQFIGMSNTPNEILELVNGNAELIKEEVTVSLENPDWDRIAEFRQHSMETGEYEKTIYIVDLRHLFYDEEKQDVWAYPAALVTKQTDKWVVETIMPEGFVATSKATGKFRSAA